MAEALGLASSLIAIAGAGISCVSALTKFGISIKGSNDKINSLAARVSLTASILSDIAKTVDENSSGFNDRGFRKTWGDVLRCCEESYEKLDGALGRARRVKGLWSKDERDGKPKISMWGKLVWALGGEDEMKGFETELDRCCQQVMMMQQAVQMSVLNLVAQRQRLSSKEQEDQQELMGKLQWLLSSLSASGVLQGAAANGKPVIVIDDDKPPKYKGLPPRDKNADRSKDVDLSKEQPDPFISFAVQEAGTKSVRFETFPAPGKRKHRSPKRPSSIGRTEPEQKPSKEPRDLFFEAYYIIPRSMPRTQENGEVRITKPSTDDYMVICVDVKKDYRSDGNLRQAVRRAKRVEESSPDSNIDAFPRTVRDVAKWLAGHRKEHSGQLNWSLVVGNELKYLQDSRFKRSFSASAYIVVLRGTPPPPKTERIHPGILVAPRPIATNQPFYTKDETRSEDKAHQRKTSAPARVESFTYTRPSSSSGIPTPPEYRKQLEEDLRKGGVAEGHISEILKKERGGSPSQVSSGAKREQGKRGDTVPSYPVPDLSRVRGSSSRITWSPATSTPESGLGNGMPRTTPYRVEEVDDPSMITLTPEVLRRQRRRRDSRKTKDDNESEIDTHKRASSYRPPRSNIDDDNITIKVIGNGRVKVGTAEIDSNEQGEIEIIQESAPVRPRDDTKSRRECVYVLPQTGTDDWVPIVHGVDYASPSPTSSDEDDDGYSSADAARPPPPPPPPAPLTSRHSSTSPSGTSPRRRKQRKPKIRKSISLAIKGRPIIVEERPLRQPSTRLVTPEEAMSEGERKRRETVVEREMKTAPIISRIIDVEEKPYAMNCTGEQESDDGSGPTLVGNEEVEEVHVSQREAEDMIMRFLKTFTVV